MKTLLNDYLKLAYRNRFTLIYTALGVAFWLGTLFARNPEIHQSPFVLALLLIVLFIPALGAGGIAIFAALFVVQCVYMRISGTQVRLDGEPK